MAPATLDRFTGCLLGLATGDALGAPHEGGWLERAVWRVIGRTRGGLRRWTDDTRMAIDLAGSLLDEGGLQPDALARRFAASYRWSRGYGPGAARVLKRIRGGERWESAARAVFPDGSFGNGAAMRAPVLALFFASDRDALVVAARTSARTTHAHPLGIEGAVLIAVAAQAVLDGRPARELLEAARSACSEPELASRLATVARWMDAGPMPGPREIAATLGNGITAPTSCPTALHVALRHLDAPFDEMMQFAIAVGGDVDTIAAMAGSLWGLHNGAARLPAVELESRDELVDLATRLFQRHQRILTPAQ